MKEKTKIVLIVEFLLLIVILFIALIGGRAFRNIGVDGNDVKATDTVDVNWEEMFPYEHTVEMVETPSIPTKVSKTDRFVGLMLKFGRIGSNWAKSMFMYDYIAKAGFVIQSRLSDPSVGNTYIKLKNGSWTELVSEQVSTDGANKAVAPYVSLQNYVEGKDFLYFYAPVKLCKYDPQLPDGVVSYANENIDAYIASMKAYNMNYVDMRENMHSDGLNHYSMFYVTDHHWTVEAGLWAASVVTSELNNRFGWSMKDPMKLGQYDYVTYENAEFGSAGVGVTHFVADSEDFTIPYPMFDTNFRLEVPSKNVDDKGSFRELFVDEEKIYSLMEDGGGSAYGKILYGNQPYERITNLSMEDGPRILMIRDSFSIAVAPYLAEVCSELVLLDVRPTNGNFYGSVVNCIDTVNPDIVLVFQNAPYNITLNK